MPYKALTDIDPFANYQKNLKAALGLAKAKILTVSLWEKYPFKEQTTALLVVGDLENPLLKTVQEKATKKGAGRCLCTADGQMLVKGSSSLTKQLIENALKAAKISLAVRTLEGNEELDSVAKGLVKDRGKTPAADAANLVQAKAKKEIEAEYQSLIQQFDLALKKLVGIDDEAKVKDWKAKIDREVKEGDYVQVKALLPSMRKDFDGVKARILEREKQQKEYEAKRGPVQIESDKAYATASPDDRKKLTVAWAQAKQAADKHAFAAAAEKLKEIEKSIPEVLARTLAAGRERLAELKREAGQLLDSPIKAETEALAKAEAAVEAQLKGGHFAAAQEALDQFEKETERLANARRDKKLAEDVAAKASSFYYNNQYDIDDKMKPKVLGALKNLDVFTKGGDWKGVMRVAAQVRKDIQNHLAVVFQKNQQKAAALKQQNDAFESALNQAEAEDSAAVAFGDGRFTSGMLRDIWRAVKGTRTASPANGSIAGTHPLGEVEAAIGTWRSVGSSGALTNFHVPGGGRPQAKWEKDFTRPEVQANFCCFWRNRKVNIHVDVEPISYFDRYHDEVDWTLVPAALRASLRR
jgi:hypothetical protein